jgi:hypothetical protein
MTPRQLTQKLNLLVAEAATTTNPEAKVKKIEEALKIACVFIKTLKPLLRDAMRDAITRLPSGSEGRTVTIKDLSFAHRELEVFRSKEAFADFLESTLDVLEAQQFLSREKFVELFEGFRRNYDAVADLKLEVGALNEIVGRLENFYCRPPYGGPGGILVGPDPDIDGPGGVEAKTTRSALDMMALLAGIGSFIVQVGEKLWPLIFTARQQDRANLPAAVEVLAFASLNSLLASIVNEFGVELTMKPRVRAPVAYA